MPNGAMAMDAPPGSSDNDRQSTKIVIKQPVHLEHPMLLKAMELGTPINLVLGDFQTDDTKAFIKTQYEELQWVADFIEQYNIKGKQKVLNNYYCFNEIKQHVDLAEKTINKLVMHCDLEEKNRTALNRPDFTKLLNEMETKINSTLACLSLKEESISPFLESITRMKETITSPPKNLEIMKKTVAALATIIEKHKVTQLQIDGFQQVSWLLEEPLRVFSNVKQFDLCSSCDIENKHLSKLSQALPSLEGLNIETNLPTEGDITPLKSFTQLTSLKLIYAFNIGGASFGDLSCLENLTEIALPNNNLQDTDVINLANGKFLKLKKLILRSNSKIGNDGILAVVKNRPQNFPQLDSFDAFSNCMNDEGAMKLVEILGMQYNPERLHIGVNHTDNNFEINVGRNKVTQSWRTKLIKDFSESSAGSSGKVQWSL